MTLRREVYWCPHFGYVNSCTCHIPIPVTWMERLVVRLAAITLLKRRTT